MLIKSVTLNNFRAYKGENTVTFNANGKNLYLIAGDNGFGKTTFLTSLVWCLYGRLMVDVDEKFKREINEAHGYKSYAKQNLNNDLADQLNAIHLPSEIRKFIFKNGYIRDYNYIKDLAQYSVSIHFTDLSIPSIPCEEMIITRAYDCFTDSETTEISIDGQTNELAREVGNDIFINDFILSRDIAKFFFFDAEKIVSMAEIKSIDEKRKLSTAYSEVLGIKKYEDIKKNLENLRLKYRRKSSDGNDRRKMTLAMQAVTDAECIIAKLTQRRDEVYGEIIECRSRIETYQERLIREGNAISVEELIKQKELRDALREKDAIIKSRLKDMLDVAPFAISGKLLLALKAQIDDELANTNQHSSESVISSILAETHKRLLNEIGPLDLTQSQQNLLMGIIKSVFDTQSPQSLQKDNDFKCLLNYSDDERNEFQALFDNIRYSFSNVFGQLVKDEKNNSIFLNKTLKKISQAEYGDDNKEIKEVREAKAEVELRLQQLEKESRNMSEKLGLLKKEYAVKNKQLSELTKKVSIDDTDKKKDEIAERLINELDAFLFKLKVRKKASLERRIKEEMGMLMHKSDFISGVHIELREDVIEIMLMAADNKEISKDKLSKGEQQLYATAILKALVDESETAFPIFIDSPLQKFDSMHSNNIITHFYPGISKQVVIFPLLGKELSEDEYKALLPTVNAVYIIRHDHNHSYFESLAPQKLFAKS